MNKNNLKAVIEGYNGRYEIEVTGNKAVVYDTVKNKEVKKYIDRGYLRVSLNNGKKNILELVHKLVAKTFILNPLNNKYIIAKDGDYTNVNPNNLVWVENQYGTFTDIDVEICYQHNIREIHEEWRSIKGYENYYISNLGRVAGGGRMLVPYFNNGTYCAGLTKNGKTILKPINRLMAEAFELHNPNNYRYVLFKDGNGANLRLDNIYYSKHNASTQETNIQGENDVTSLPNQTKEVITSDENIEQDNNDTKTPKERLIDISIKMVEEGASDEEIRTLITMLSKM